jgi:hypothetical protein
MANSQRDAKREQVWRRHIEQQPRSGLTVRGYCRAHNLREPSFFYWRRVIAFRDRVSAATSSIPSSSGSSRRPAFVPVAVVASPARREEAPIEIRLAEGHRVRVRSGCDRALLADVLALLRRSAPEGRPC